MRGDSDFSPDVCVGQGVGVGKLEGGLSFYLGSPAELRAGCGARGAAEVPGGGGGSAAAAAPPGAPADSGRGLRMGSARSPRKKLQHPNTKRPHQTNKNQQGKGGKWEGAGRWSRGQGAGGSGQSGSAALAGPGLRRVPAARRATAGTPGVSPGPGTEESWRSYAAAPLRVPVVAVRSGDERSAFWRSAVSCY